MKIAVKVPLQLLVEHTLRDRLLNIKKQTSIPISKTVSDILEKHLREYEERHDVQPELPMLTKNSQV